MREPMSSVAGAIHTCPCPSTQKCTIFWRWDLHHSLSQSKYQMSSSNEWMVQSMMCTQSELQPQSWWNATACPNIDETQVKNPGRKYHILQEIINVAHPSLYACQWKVWKRQKQRPKVAEGLGAKEKVRTDYLTGPRALSWTAETA